MNPYVVAAYAIVLASLAGYAAWLARRARALERAVHDLPGTGSLAGTEDA